ncbi:MAG: NAD(P)-dependent glycerol-3-phosphate dehydrogenase [Alphaproteobacteria bacterium]|nr:NAD(P)-dependent glycerol-3-phosphate dehydrogenase [Alphaproteobacteria bacterium]MCD8520503.1 NAD(P)-dependent glycerol-3-phosphate dehydrogenase [Alphaproteobacteria bacterium]
MKSIGVIGGGAWGTALAEVYARADRKTLLWARETEVVDSINTTHENTPFLPGVKLSPNLKATGDMADMKGFDILLLVTPAQHLGTSLKAMQSHLHKGQHLVICAKGIEITSGKLLTDIAAAIAPDCVISVLTGPTFAKEIASGCPAAVTLALADKAAGEELQAALATSDFRPYLTQDVIGTQVGGSIKNVIAIACGMAHGKGLGESARAALLTRGLAEMGRLSEALGGNAETLMGLCGVGDLTLTANSMQSRNFSLGAALGEGKTMAEVLATRSAVTEGVHTAEAALKLAATLNIEMPITAGVYACLHGGESVATVMKALMARPLGKE